MSSMTLGEPLHAWTWRWPQNTAISRLARFLTRLRALVAAQNTINRAVLMAVAEPSAHAAPLQHSISSPDETMRRFQHMIIPHLDAAYNFARFLSRDADAAEDIVQEAFLRAYRGFGGFRDGDARAWTFTIVRNCYHAWLQERRRKSRYEQPMTDERDLEQGSPSPDPASEEDTPEAAFIRKTETLRVREVINRLPDTMREVLVLRELEDLSYKEIAEIIDAPIGTVMSRLARARRDFGELWRRLDEKGAAR
ncbi:sigma-70 family RNA polymerase sigma factor [Rhizobium sp. P40RR-XXII]|uniref:sigma-70 family RNA polymerase sigma factor n=1 Tax=unclassified Rhizobium TaxID=2613769 RepID=UPI001456628E|nr:MULTISPECIES: sigma-70 family RNA polymerase sigma factor [unclassified Rhizobium]NLR84136.1 sigma-70 family RNA polymerase sigma factor [Rhizobium sp. P28RR-XV]NLS15218.1 sigma-70 family RNA polymerase sigma factor [Rhizobium sp. P40RR-XXII]